MANPVLIDIPKDDWTKIATNITSGFVHNISYTPAKYLQTYRVTGEAAPVSLDEGVPLFHGKIVEEISASERIDVYICAKIFDGKIRVDL